MATQDYLKKKQGRWGFEPFDGYNTIESERSVDDVIAIPGDSVIVPQ